MDKLLTKNGRIRFNLILCACGILLMVPVGCFNTKFPTETTKMIGNIGLFTAWFIIVGLVLYIERSVPTIPDLLNAVEKEMGEFKATAEAWANIKTKHIKFAEASLREKLFEVFMIIMGIGFMVYGILDYCNRFPVMKFRTLDGFDCFDLSLGKRQLRDTGGVRSVLHGAAPPLQDFRQVGGALQGATQGSGRRDERLKHEIQSAGEGYEIGA